MTFSSLAVRLAPPAARASFGRALAVAGPAFVVSVGYVDPGNWATDLAAGQYGYRLLWAAVLASVMAIVVQVLVVRLTFATGETLAQTLARQWPRLRLPLFFSAHGAAIATDLAEFTGIVVGLRLLFGMPLPGAAMCAVIIVPSLLLLGNHGLRRIEVLLIGFVSVIALGYVYEVALFRPPASEVWQGALVPRIPAPAAIGVIVGIIGATVMPHNLFLHSTFISERLGKPTWAGCAQGVRWFTRETVVALTVALLINGAILVVGAAIGGADGSIELAYRTMLPLAGGAASAVFGATLLCSGIAASAAATIAGETIARDLAPFQVPRWLRRLGTLAPAFVLTLAGVDASALLLWSQIALALVLPAVVIPLVVLTRRDDIMGALPLSGFMRGAGVLTAGLCVVFDVALLAEALIS